VTDQGSAAVLVSVSIPGPQTESGETEPAIEESPCLLITCIVCGRSGYWIESFYESG
jgi:hypothetical protein